jgi:putative transposase
LINLDCSITVSARQRAILEKWMRNQAGSPYRLVGVDQQRVRRWRTRWAENEERLAATEQEGASEKDLTQLLSSLLADHERPGTPPTFTAEQLTQIIGVACEVPEESGRPVTHWTPTELADEVIQRGIVESISPRHVDRVLKGGICAHTRASTG